MSAASIDKLAWLLIYAGLAGMSAGIFVRRDDFHLGWVIIAGGVVATTAGALLIYLRSRIQNDPGAPR